jgi:hypothetical protein
VAAASAPLWPPCSCAPMRPSCGSSTSGSTPGRIGLIFAGMTHQGWDVQLTAYAARTGARGIAHSIVDGTGVRADAVAREERR